MFQSLPSSHSNYLMVSITNKQRVTGKPVKMTTISFKHHTLENSAVFSTKLGIHMPFEVLTILACAGKLRR